MKVKRSFRVTAPVHPSIGFQLVYRKALDKMIDQMHRSVMYWLLAAFKADPPRIARDAKVANVHVEATKKKSKYSKKKPATKMQQVMDEMTKQWNERFEKGSQELAKYFAKSVHKRSSLQLKKILKDAGFSVQTEMTATQRDIFAAVVNENVHLIKSIPQQYLGSVQQKVMAAVAHGNDQAELTKQLQKSYGVTKRRAKLIARDQTSKANSAFTRANQMDLGITEAIWKHSHAGKVPRPSHVANDGKRYSLKTGWYDPDEKQWIFPGELINCRCLSRSIIPELGE